MLYISRLEQGIFTLKKLKSSISTHLHECASCNHADLKTEIGMGLDQQILWLKKM